MKNKNKNIALSGHKESQWPLPAFKSMIVNANIRPITMDETRYINHTIQC